MYQDLVWIIKDPDYKDSLLEILRDFIIFPYYMRWNHHKSFELRVAAPLTFWVPDIFQAWNRNLIMKYGPSDQFLQVRPWFCVPWFFSFSRFSPFELNIYSWEVSHSFVHRLRLSLAKILLKAAFFCWGNPWNMNSIAKQMIYLTSKSALIWQTLKSKVHDLKVLQHPGVNTKCLTRTPSPTSKTALRLPLLIAKT